MDDGFELDEIEIKASEYAKLAIKFDNELNFEAALIYYKVSSNFLILLSIIVMVNFFFLKLS